MLSEIKDAMVQSVAALGLDEVSQRFLREVIESAQLADAEEWLAGTGDIGRVAPEVGTASRNTVLDQLSPEVRDVALGAGSATIRRSGCFLVTFTMAANRLTGSTHDLAGANEQIRRAGGFRGSDLDVPKATQALGLTVKSRHVASESSLAAAEAALDRNDLVFAGVDYKAGKSSAVSAADHFLLITGRDGDTLTAVDPAGGRDLVFRKAADGSYRAGRYTITEVGVLAASERTPKLAVRPLQV